MCLIYKLYRVIELENQVLQQILDYLIGKITKEEYSGIAQEYMTLHGDNLIERNILFYQKFMELVPDICLYYVDEPGDSDHKEREFRKNIQLVYRELMNLK